MHATSTKHQVAYWNRDTNVLVLSLYVQPLMYYVYNKYNKLETEASDFSQLHVEVLTR